MRALLLPAQLPLLLGLAACGSLSGLDGNNSFACKAPSGVRCESMTGIYANARQANLPGQRLPTPAAPTAAEAAAGAASQLRFERVLGRAPDSGTPIRSAPRVLRLWFAPWEDTDGDLHDQSYVYLQVDAGHWLIEHNRRRIQDSYRPVHAPSTPVLPVAVTGSTASGPAPAPGLESIGTVQLRPAAAEALLDGIATPARGLGP